LSHEVPDGQKRRGISTGQASLFGKTGQPGVCLRTKHPMTKSDAEREKEGHMTHKFLMTIAIVAIALAPRLALVLPRPTALAEGFMAVGFTAEVFTADTAAIIMADTGVVSTAGMAAGFTAGMVASILATMDMAIPHTVTTVTDRAELVAWDRAAPTLAFPRGSGVIAAHVRFAPFL
jgi:hypothetical protein